jgi:hypothetical protein
MGTLGILIDCRGVTAAYRESNRERTCKELSMDDELDRTIRIRRDGKTGTDSKGRTVWTKPVETVELELVSTAMLEKLLASGDETQRERIRALAESDDGVLAMDPTSKELETISDSELESALNSASQTGPYEPAPSGGSGRGRAADVAKGSGDSSGDPGETMELSLVTTQMLRKILAGDDPKDADEPESPRKKGGYNPYDRG